jgi:hypothetical protein
MNKLLKKENDIIMDNNNKEISNSEMDELTSKSCELTMNFDDCSLSNKSKLIDVPISSISSQSIIPEIVRVDDKAYSAKFSLETIINLGESIEFYLPLITAVATLTQQIVEAYKNAQYNKKSCAILIQRVQAAEVTIQALDRYKLENEKNFCKQTYYYPFERFIVILREIKEFVQDVTHLSGYKNLFQAITLK